MSLVQCIVCVYTQDLLLMWTNNDFFLSKFDFVHKRAMALSTNPGLILVEMLEDALIFVNEANPPFHDICCCLPKVGTKEDETIGVEYRV
jgi:hypothetical protein